uniref:THAP-type domain-containing protein n=1 Tax=Amphimedon queenslandica TaxID=400682 RepID=A0A1X7URF6_AMPQE
MPGHSCCIINCESRSSLSSSSSSTRFFRIPKVIHHQGEQTKCLSERRLTTWLSRINRKGWSPKEHSRICSLHFGQGEPASLYAVNDPDWAPSLNLGYTQYESQVQYEAVAL